MYFKLPRPLWMCNICVTLFAECIAENNGFLVQNSITYELKYINNLYPISVQSIENYGFTETLTFVLGMSVDKAICVVFTTRNLCGNTF